MRNGFASLAWARLGFPWLFALGTSRLRQVWVARQAIQEAWFGGWDSNVVCVLPAPNPLRLWIWFNPCCLGQLLLLALHCCSPHCANCCMFY